MEAEEYVSRTLYRKLTPGCYFYHDIKHTQDVYKHAIIYAKMEKLSQKQTLLIGIAALFHDIGYIVAYDKNEPIGAKLAKEYLYKKGFASDNVNTVSDLIIATQMPQKPQSLMQMIICDADLDSLGRKDFFRRGNLLKSELEKVKGIRYTKKEWDSIQLNFIKNHKYFTKSARKLRDKSQKLNIIALERLLSCFMIRICSSFSTDRFSWLICISYIIILYIITSYFI